MNAAFLDFSVAIKHDTFTFIPRCFCEESAFRQWLIKTDSS
jgi:hypothetical protein